jgi:hypothetical protein
VLSNKFDKSQSPYKGGLKDFQTARNNKIDELLLDVKTTD